MCVKETVESIFEPFFPKNVKFPSEQFAFLEQAVFGRYQDIVDAPFKDYLAFAFRHPKNSKWYGLAMLVHPSKLGLAGEADIPILLIRCEKNKSPELIDNERIFPAYHMNKGNWVTIPLDYKMDNERVLKHLLDSRRIVGEK